jgi:hypothetical protein
MATATPEVGRLDNIISELERLHADAQDIFDAHINYRFHVERGKVPFGVLKSREIAAPAGSAINYVEALKIVRKKIIGA